MAGAPDYHTPLPDLLDSNARVAHRVNSAGTPVARRRINWPSGVTITDDPIDEEVDVAITGFAAWTSYTPTLTQTGAVTKTVDYAKYVQVGKTVVGSVSLTVTGAGTTNTDVLVGVPVTAAVGSGVVIGMAQVFDDSAGASYLGVCRLASTTTLDMMRDGATAPIGQTPNFALASPDLIRLSFHYEAA